MEVKLGTSLNGKPVELPLISVVIPAYNAEKTLPACLAALGSQTRQPHEVIVVDDGSTDRTAEIARQHKVLLISQSQKGPAAARNAGVKHTSGDIIVFTDSDCIPTPEWLENLTAPLHDPAIVGVKGTYASRQKSLVARFVQQEYESKYIRLQQQATIDFIDTYSAAYRRDVFVANDGFDESFRRPSVEDQEFSFRLARKGYRMVFAADATVFHQHDEDISDYIQRKYGIGYWKAYMLRWLPEKTLSDSHTSPSQRWQILFVAAGLVSLVAGLIFPMAFVAVHVSVLLLLLTSTPLFAQIFKRDTAVLVVAPLLVLLRATALGLGLMIGMLFAPRKRTQAVGLSLWTRPIKRLVDVAGALVGLVISLPVVLISALVIRLDSPGNPFYVQTRAGENGKPFRMLKLRTMVSGADEYLPAVLQKNTLAGPVFKLRDDPRVTRVGRFLRRWSLDELPQFWNILLGDMSLVGPRPEELRFVELYNEQQRLRLIVKPGLTGPAQVAGRGQLNFDQRLQLELDYINNYSPIEDLRILLRSIGAVIGGRGAY